ncbi:hypothetical protein AB0M38_15825 [Streptomyces sp. NPDC051742]
MTPLTASPDVADSDAVVDSDAVAVVDSDAETDARDVLVTGSGPAVPGS